MKKLTFFIIALSYLGFVRTGASAEFHLSITPGSSLQDTEAVLKVARAHRKASPADTIIIDFPPKLTWNRALQIGAEDSGRADAPLILRGADGGTTITGGVELPALQPIDSSDPIYDGLPASSRQKIRKTKIDIPAISKSTAFAPHGSFQVSNPGRLFVYEGSERLSPAQWPSRGEMPAENPTKSADGKYTSVKLPRDVAGIVDNGNIWVTGAWGWNWWFETNKAASIKDGVLTFPTPNSPIRTTARYHLFNVVNGLDHPGVYYYSPQNEIYLFPSNGGQEHRLFAASADRLLHVTRASNIQIERMAFRQTTGSAIWIQNSTNVSLSDCYVGQTGTQGIVIENGTENWVKGCLIDDTGYEGVSISGGDAKALTAGNNGITGSRITRSGQELPSYRPGVRLSGVGLKIENCEISDEPHSAIIFSGNDHIINGNVLHDLVQRTTDAGAIYSGRSWTSRGTIISNNLIENVKNKIDDTDVRGVYFDDQLSGNEIKANIFHDVDEPILIGGGRENIVDSNLSLHSKTTFLRIDARGLTWQADLSGVGGSLRKGLSQTNYQRDPYASRYSGLAKLLDDLPGAPMHNVFSNNIADVSPVVTYDPPATHSLGTDSNNRTMDLPHDPAAAIAAIDPASSTFTQLTTALNRTNSTRENIKNLFF